MIKEKYYTSETLAADAAALAASLPVNRRAPAFRPQAAALLVMDMQDYFLRPESHAFLPAAPAIVPVVQALAAAFKKAGQPVFFTRHANRAGDAGQMAIWWREVLVPEHPLGGLQAGLAGPADPVIEKTQYDAFFKTDLEERLRRSGVEQLVITGVTTHLCCESTARSAFMRGFAVFTAIDGTATLNRELHAASLRAMAHGFAVPLLASALLTALAGAS